jgi:D-sedoheptulose 7-phosphate isomerase
VREERVAGTWQETIDTLHGLLARVSFTDAAQRPLEAEAGFTQWTRSALDIRARHQTIFLIGNGASASMASHFAADLAKNGHVHTEVFTDLSLITAISNDMGYEHVYAEPLRRRGRRGDMLVAISSSGRSPNILAAVAVARELGLEVVSLSAMSPENPLRRGGSLNVHLPCRSYGEAETGHAAILHHWMDRVAASGEAA